MSAIHRHEPELFENPEAGVCHHSEPFCERCNPALFRRQAWVESEFAAIEQALAEGDRP